MHMRIVVLVMRLLRLRQYALEISSNIRISGQLRLRCFVIRNRGLVRDTNQSWLLHNVIVLDIDPLEPPVIGERDCGNTRLNWRFLVLKLSEPAHLVIYLLTHLLHNVFLLMRFGVWLLQNTVVEEFTVDVIVKGSDLWVSSHHKSFFDGFDSDQTIDFIIDSVLHQIQMLLKPSGVPKEDVRGNSKLQLHEINNLLIIQSIPLEKRVII